MIKDSFKAMVIDTLNENVEEVFLEDIGEKIDQMLEGKHT